MLKSALLIGVGVIIGAGAIHGLHAASGPAVYTVYEATVTDEDAYKKALPEAQKIIKDAGGTYIAGGFNKAKVNYGKPEAGNRYVIIHFENEAAANKFWDGGGRAWVEKNAPGARNLMVEGVEAK